MKRRRKRVTFFDVVRATRYVVNDPNFDPADRQEFAEAVAEKVLESKDTEAIDWEKLIELIIKYLPIILGWFT